jgi:hypothetical protein
MPGKVLKEVTKDGLRRKFVEWVMVKLCNQLLRSLRYTG